MLYADFFESSLLTPLGCCTDSLIVVAKASRSSPHVRLPSRTCFSFMIQLIRHEAPNPEGREAQAEKRERRRGGTGALKLVFWERYMILI